MAEIRVRPKRRSLAWLWIVLALVVLALVAWYLMSAGIIQLNSSSAPRATTTSMRTDPAFTVRTLSSSLYWS